MCVCVCAREREREREGSIFLDQVRRWRAEAIVRESLGTWNA